MISRKQAQRQAKRLFRVCLVNGMLDEQRTVAVVDRVVEANRSGTLAVLAQLRRLLQLEIGRHTARVESATALPEPMRAGIEAGLVHTHGPGLATSFAENPALIAGIRIKVGGDIYDDSIKARLEALKAAF